MSELWPYPGSRWWKFDFHTHTPESKDTPWHPLIGNPGEELTPEAWLLKFMEAEIDCVAVTDHNSGQWIDRLKTAYQGLKDQQPNGFRELVIYPGVELSLCEGLHMLAIFDPKYGSPYVCSLLGAVGFPPHLHGETDAHDGTACTRKSLVEVVEEILRSGGLPIPAHVDQNKGLLQILGDGQQARHSDALKSAAQVGILAYEVVNPSTRRADLYDQLDLQWTQVVGSDCHSFRSQNLPGSAYTWVKMAKPSIEGLRLALIDGNGVSVRRYDDSTGFSPFKTPEHFIESLEISRARYMGQGEPSQLRFSPYFNAIIGGRGTGKSTVVHALRLCYAREHELLVLDKTVEPRQTFDRFNQIPKGRAGQGGLLADTELTLVLSRDGVRHRLTWAENGQRLSVDEWDGTAWQRSVSQSITSDRFPLRLFSQGQIASLAGGEQRALLDVLDEAAGTKRFHTAFDAAKNRYLELCAQVRSLDQQILSQESVSIELGDVQRKLSRFDDTHHADGLRAYQEAVRQKRELERQHSRITELSSKLAQATGEFYLEDVPEGLLRSPEDDEAIQTLANWGRSIEQTRAIVDQASSELLSSADHAYQILMNGPWFARANTAVEEYDRIRTQLQSYGVSDPSEFGRLVQERQRLETEMQRLVSLRQRSEELAKAADEQFDLVLAARRDITLARARFLNQTLAQNDYVRIEVLPYGRDGVTIDRQLRDVLGVGEDQFKDDIFSRSDNDLPDRGAVADLLDGLESGPDAAADSESRLSLLKNSLLMACRGQATGYGGRFTNALKREYAKRPELVNYIQCWFPDDSLRVEYSRRGNGTDFKPIEQGSAGQRAAAMLAFLLTHGEEPLILDQPEDDLDNHLIYDLVVRQIRENKQRRQLIIVTHNPNIVVNGDADMVYAMNFKRGQCVVSHKGSLQDLDMRREVCRVMEGGEEAFTRRYRRLGPEASNHVR